MSQRRRRAEAKSLELAANLKGRRKYLPASDACAGGETWGLGSGIAHVVIGWVAQQTRARLLILKPMTNGGGNDHGETERLSFVLPSFPISFNQLYAIDHVRRRVRLSDNALLWKTRTVPFVKPCRWPDDWLLKLTLEYESAQWHYKNGNLRRLDVQNLEKLVIDTLFAKWGWDDSRLVEIVSRKTWGPREQIKVIIERVEISLREPGCEGMQSL